MSLLLSIPYMVTIKLLYSQRKNSFIPGKLLLFTALIFVLSVLARAIMFLFSNQNIDSILELTDTFLVETLSISVFSSVSWPIGFAFLVLYNLRNRAQKKYEENRILLEFLEKTKQEETEARLQIEQSDRLSVLGVLASGMIHEIKNPNNCILLNAENLMDLLVKSKGLIDGSLYSGSDIHGIPVLQMDIVVEQMLRGILDSSYRISRLVSELQDFSRPRVGETFRYCSIADLTESVQRMLVSKIRKSTDHFHVEIAEDLPQIRIQKQRIGQVLLNLVNNALESLQSRSQSVKILVRSGPEESTVQFVVSDEGGGMSEDDLRHIFDPFYTTKESLGGTGLGLPVCNRIVMDHKGILDFDSTPGQGTIVFLTLPVDSRKEAIQ